MAIETNRTHTFAQVVIDHDRCDACGLCVAVCKGAPLTMIDRVVQVDQSLLFGCIACGQCMAVCPQDCIQVDGRDLSPEDMFSLPQLDFNQAYDSLTNLLVHRRSVRNFQNTGVPRKTIQQVLDAVATAPMGIPPSDVEVLVFDNPDAVQRFSADVMAYFHKINWLFSDVMLTLLRPFISKENAAVFRGFLAPAIRGILEKYAQGEDWLTYNAPCALYFYTSPYADQADPIIAATYAMLAAESLGLGSCMLGTIPYCFRYDRKLRHKYRIPNKSQQGLMLILGYPAIPYQKGILRRLGAVRHIS
jgi:ferredoxin